MSVLQQSPETATGKSYDVTHIVTLQETNVVGNVYFANYFLWQGIAREHFLRDHAPSVLQEFQSGLSMVTTDSKCQFFSESFAFDEIRIKMRLTQLRPKRGRMNFEYFRVQEGTETLIATGEQGFACMRKDAAGKYFPCPIPEDLYNALRLYAAEGSKKEVLVGVD